MKYISESTLLKWSLAIAAKGQRKEQATCINCGSHNLDDYSSDIEYEVSYLECQDCYDRFLYKVEDGEVKSYNDREEHECVASKLHAIKFFPGSFKEKD